MYDNDSISWKRLSAAEDVMATFISDIKVFSS